MFKNIMNFIKNASKPTNELRNRIFLFIAYELEGRGYDKDDPAGATIYGLTRMYTPKHYNAVLEAASSGDKEQLNNAIIKAYTEIYNDYHCDILQFPVDMYYFDFAFNAGSHAVATLQSAANIIIIDKNMNLPKLVVDGVFGRHTRKTVKAVAKYKHELYIELKHKRHQFYLHNPLERYIKGWCNRCDKLEYLLDYLLIQDN